ncbi:MAG: type IV pilin [Candidatus Thermoplasmatota archaeon]|nr:type IV pilin [Candidatus Thermoplasmatota archaeon]
MSLKLFKRKAWSDDSAVSEIIGNILILMITVMLFSGIMVFVNQMPVPELATKTDFVGSVSFDASGTEATLTITHSGGAVLPANYTTVFILIDDVSYTYKLSEDAEFTHDYWATGLDWTKTFNSTSYSSVITVTVIDDVKHSAVWVSQLSGGMGGGPPTILQRYVDSNVNTPTADYIKAGDDFSLFVKVIDLDGDLDTTTSGVWVDSRSIGGVENDTYEVASGGWFRWDYTDVTDDVVSVDGKVLIIHAKDTAGHESISNFKISVIVLPVEPGDVTLIETPTDEGGLPSYLTFSSPILGSGYGVYGENLTNNTPTERADVNDARTTFDKDERVFVRVASTQMTNIMGRNDLTLKDTRTGLTYIPTFFNQSAVNVDNPFYVYGSAGSAQIYQAKFNTSGLPPSAYSMNIYLRSAGTDEVVFQTDITLIIQQEGSPITFIPQIYLFSDATMTIPFGTKTTPYDVNGGTHTIYASMNVQDAQSTPPYPVVGEIRIEDLTGGAEIYGTPPAGAMISNFVQDATNASHQRYSFTIDLRINNADQWLSGSNTYTLRISSFSDNNEGIYSLAKQVYIKASVSKMDFFTATNGIYSTRGGSTNFVNPEYIYYIENNNFFTTRVLHDQSNSPSAAAMYYMTAMAVGDLDGDADDDLIAAQFKPSGSGYVAEGHLLYFENSMNSYGNWQAPSFITRASADDTTVKIEWIAAGDTNGDGDIDIMYATEAHKLFIYNNTYGAAAVRFLSSAYGSGNDGIRKIDLKDMNGDDAADLIVLANGIVYVYDIKNWRTTPIATIQATSGTSNIEDFDIADVNGDGMLDVLTADPNSASGNSIEGVWVNYYRESTSPTVKLLDQTFTPVVTYGAISPSTLPTSVTYTQVNDTQATAVQESAVSGIASATFKVQALTADKDQILHVTARTVGNDESFYIWYSIDSTNGIDGKFTPVIVVTNGTTNWREYTFRLPSNVAGHTMFIRVTDSLNSYGSLQDSLELNYVSVHSSVFGSYMTTRTNIVTVTPVYACVRAMNIDGIGSLEIVAAKNGNWSTFYASGTGQYVSGWSVTNSYLYIYGPGMTLVSPTLFTVADVNGDSYSDVVASFTPSSIGSASQISVIGVYINIDNYWYVQIKDHYAGYLSGTETGSILYLLVSDVMHESS